MAKVYNVTCPDPEKGSLTFYVGGDGLGHVVARWDVSDLSGAIVAEIVDRTLPQAVTDNGITSGERTTLIAILTKLRTYLRSQAGLT